MLRSILQYPEASCGLPPETGSIAVLDIWSEAGADTEVLFDSTGPSSIRIMKVTINLLGEGIAVLIKADPDMELIAEASEGEEVIRQS